ncbi:MAG: FAD/NAD(P)-binding protein [Desulfuromonadaceae bacterium]|nr:FAD/NAD(P)-binding protein [Desulfuromonadaceae bacterium]MDD2848827.1 FAD/NAD(P)-binding protein [Desulfuromonadaceae bacterium]MDD4132216.1 FAD/NAD(P)-binding protein [Desulfuromonadaceae bacterium]
MNNNLPVPAVISTIRPLTVDTSLFTLYTEPFCPVAASFLPGQFLELSLPGVGEIPLSYCGFPSQDGRIELCVRHVGHVTTPLKVAAPGDAVGVRGPFGRGFPLSAYGGQDLLLIAGGLGIAPLRSLLLALMNRRELWGRLTLLYGARETGALLFLDELLELQKRGEVELQMSVDHQEHCLDGPPCCRIALLPALLDQLELDPGRIFAAICGPPVVYPLLVSRLQRMGLSDENIHLSLERRMKCGVGRCGHCAVGTRLCCVDGPVFSFAELAGIEGSLV